MILKLFFSFLFTTFISFSVYSSEDIPRTGWGAVLKVPVEEIEYVDKWLVEWGNWISATTYGKSLIIEIHEECRNIVLSKGYDIGIEANNYNLKLITDKGSLLKASMLRDFESGKKTECEHILGYLIELAKSNNVKCDLIKAAHTRIQVGL